MDLSVLVGGGGILSTAEDLSKFVNAQFDRSNLELALTRKSTFTIDKDTEWGLAWLIIKTEDEQNIFYHSGGTPGYTSFFVFNVKTKNVIIILSNVSEQSEKSKYIGDLGFALLSTLSKK